MGNGNVLHHLLISPCLYATIHFLWENFNTIVKFYGGNFLNFSSFNFKKIKGKLLVSLYNLNKSIITNCNAKYENA